MKLASQAEEDASKARAAYDAAQEKVRLHQRMISARSVKGKKKSQISARDPFFISAGRGKISDFEYVDYVLGMFGKFTDLQ